MPKEYKRLPKYIQIKENDESDDLKTVLTKDYIIAKTNQLKEFGYDSLTEEGVREQLLNLLNCKELNVIGVMMKEDFKTNLWCDENSVWRSEVIMDD